MKDFTPVTDCRSAVYYAKKLGVNINVMIMNKKRFDQFVKSHEFIILFNRRYPNGADMTRIRVNKVMREISLPKIVIAKL